MATIELTADNFEDTIRNNDIVLIDFWADWCGPCKSFGPTFQKVAEKHDDIAFAKVDTDKEQQLAAEFGIRSIPTVAVIRDRTLLFAQAGALPESALEDLVRKTRDLDMEQVRAEIAEQDQRDAPQTTER